MFEHFLRRWVGIALSLVGVVAILWLGLTGQLELYIHPRYVVFTVVMAVLGGALAIGAFLFVPADDAGAHEDHGHTDGPRPWWRAAVSIGGTALIVVAAVAGLLVLPPAALTSATAENREVSDASVLASADTTALVGGDSSTFTVKDWATLLRQGLGEDFFTGKPADISGFVLGSDDPDVFYVARFLVTCCAVDAQPLGVPVYLPGWQDDYAVDEWVEVRGGFSAHPDPAAENPMVLVPDELVVIERPAQPYVY